MPLLAPHERASRSAMPPKWSKGWDVCACRACISASNVVLTSTMVCPPTWPRRVSHSWESQVYRLPRAAACDHRLAHGGKDGLRHPPVVSYFTRIESAAPEFDSLTGQAREGVDSLDFT